MRLAGVGAAAAFASSALFGCDPVYEYCVTIRDCSSEAPLEGVKVRFDHEGLLDQRTNGSGRACSSNVGSPSPHDVRILLEKDGYSSRQAIARGGSALDVELCMCRLEDANCTEASVEDAGAGDGGGP